MVSSRTLHGPTCAIGEKVNSMTAVIDEDGSTTRAVYRPWRPRQQVDDGATLAAMGTTRGTSGVKAP
jgi:hypothetical protein